MRPASTRARERLGVGGAPDTLWRVNSSVAVVGAGPGGLGVAGALAARGIQATVFERAEQVAPVWGNAYARLRLNTARTRSRLPGSRFPGSGRWATREEFVAYLDDYVVRHRLTVRTGTEVLRIDQADHGWAIHTPVGAERFEQVVVASGYNAIPTVPDWEGDKPFQGVVMHSSQYQDGAAYRGKRATVIGIGNSGADIAADLLDHGAIVSLVVRTPPHIVAREPFGVPADLVGIALRRLPAWAGDRLVDLASRPTVALLRRHGIDAPREGAITRHRRDGGEPTIDSGIIRALKDNRLRVLPGAVVQLTGSSVLLDTGSSERADVVIAATGFRSGLRSLVGHLDILDDRDCPLAHGAGTDHRYPGLRFVGYTLPISGNLRELRHEARHAARAIDCELRTSADRRYTFMCASRR